MAALFLLQVPSRKGPPTWVLQDEEVARGTPAARAKFSALRPAFVSDGTGTVTAASSSTISDGAAALVCRTTPLRLAGVVVVVTHH